jgi:hypothetical protein
VTTLEAPLRIEDREELVFVLCEAAELEHSLVCAYLFAAWSLRTEDGALPPGQLEAVRTWERTITGIAIQEMTHLALVSNLLTALGAAPHLARPNLPQRARYYPQDVQLSLEPFTAATLRHFIYLERPEGMEGERDAPEFPPVERTEVGWHGPGRVIPRGQHFATVGHLYRGIAAGYRLLVDRLGEPAVFLGSPRAQASRADFGFPELVPVVDLASALQTIDTIVEEGEGARGDWTNAHYGRFLAVERKLAELTAEDPGFAPARPVLANPFVRQPFDCDPVNLLSAPFTIEVAELANAAYAVMLQILARSFASTNETDEELHTLAGVSVGAMFRLLKPLGVLLTHLPAGANHPGMTAGMSFELYRSLHLLPHRRAAWALLHERLRHVGRHADTLAAQAPDAHAAEVLGGVAAGFTKLADRLADRIAEHLPYTSGPR